MYGLVDCNNFYASCERLFNPALEGKPVVVLSNNDGCVIARSNEAKALGIKMGTPAFQMKELIEKNKISVFSSNYTLYGDLSTRVMNTLTEMCPGVEVYSIDESFIDFSGMNNFDLNGFGINIKRKIRQETGIPVSVGIAKTKTLAKLANKIAKKNNGVFVLDSEEKRIETLRTFPIEDIWGIGRQYSVFLEKAKINNALQLSIMPEDWIKKNMSIVGLRLVKELNGISCNEMNPPRDNKKNICTSRSFGVMIEDFTGISEAMANHANTCARKLRVQGSCCNVLTVFIHTNFFRKDLPQYSKSINIKLPVPTNNSNELIKYSMEALKLIYKKGYSYKKAGVLVSGLIPEDNIQLNLFENGHKLKSSAMNKAMDDINNRFGKTVVKISAMGFKKRWSLKQEKLSPCYTTRWEDIPIVKIK